MLELVRRDRRGGGGDHRRPRDHESGTRGLRRTASAGWSGSSKPGARVAAARCRGHAELTPEQIVANAAVLLFGGIETTEGMIANARAGPARSTPTQLERTPCRPDLRGAAIEESLRREPAAAAVDRYATGDVELGVPPRSGGASSSRSRSAPPTAIPPVRRSRSRSRSSVSTRRRHLAFAQGPHVCLGVHLARLEARAGLAALLARLPGLRLDAAKPFGGSRTGVPQTADS